MTYQDNELIRDVLTEARECGVDTLDAGRALNRELHRIVQENRSK